MEGIVMREFNILKSFMRTVSLTLLILVSFIICICHAGDRIILTDDAERKVDVPRSPKRIVVLNSSNLELLYAVGGRAVGRPESTGISEELFKKVKSLPSIGETPNPNVEKIVSLKPDLVIGVNVGFHHNIVPALEQAKIPVLLLSLNSYEDIAKKIELYGMLTGNEKRAKEVISKIHKRVEEIQKRSRGFERKKVVIIWGSTQSFNMALPTSFVGNLLDIAGGFNIAANAKPLSSMPQYAPLSLEYVIRQNPDVVLFITHGYDDKVMDKIRKDITSHPAWNGMRAVKENMVYRLPYALFGVNPAIRVADAIEHLANLLYPEAKKGGR